ncbi:MAG: hypothetical protein KME26_03600 [Oscillatoria princeps RMCB-10]|jgi:hypothetical protein|nr:hypothetical protein [Oscillatoria princeps RMCB-10]
MEPFGLIAVNTATFLAIKVVEGAAGKLGEKLFDRGGKFLSLLKQKSPRAASAIELAQHQPLDYGQAVLEVQAAAKANPEIAQAVQEIETAVKADPKIAEAVQKEIALLKSQQPTIQNQAKLAEQVEVLNQGVINKQQTIEHSKGINITGGTQTFGGPINI